MKRTKRMTAEELINRLESLSVSDKEKKLHMLKHSVRYCIPESPQTR